jgi:hypothetical protein
MKLDPGMHIVLHLVFFGKSGVTICQVPEKTLGKVNSSPSDMEKHSAKSCLLSVKKKSTNPPLCPVFFPSTRQSGYSPSVFVSALGLFAE